MGRERRRRDRRQRRVEQTRPRRRNQRGHTTYEPAGPIEFPGVMGWLQRRMKLIVVSGIVFLVVSLGAGTLFATNLGTPPPPDPTPTPAATPAPPTDDEDEDPDEDIQRTYEAAPEMMIDPGGRYEAVIHLEGGRAVRLELFADEAPGYVNNFVFLAQNRFFEGLTFHRVVPGFVAQAGDPRGDGTGGPGYWLDEERNRLPFETGVISMAKAGDRVSGSQFFITLRPTPTLQGDFTVFGRVLEGFEHVEGLAPGDPHPAGTGDVIERIEIIEEAD